jgi:hypothetical protein
VELEGGKTRMGIEVIAPSPCEPYKKNGEGPPVFFEAAVTLEGGPFTRAPDDPNDPSDPSKTLPATNDEGIDVFDDVIIGHKYTAVVKPRDALAPTDPRFFPEKRVDFVITAAEVAAAKKTRPTFPVESVTVERTGKPTGQVARNRIKKLAEHEANLWDALGNDRSWHRLDQYSRIIFSSGVKQQRPRSAKQVAHLTKPGDRDWCFIFSVWVVWQAVNPCIHWDDAATAFGGAPKGFPAPIPMLRNPTTQKFDQLPEVGDIVKVIHVPTPEHPNDPQHHGIVIDIVGESVITVEGNVADPSTLDRQKGSNGSIVIHRDFQCLRRGKRPFDKLQYFIRTVP